VTSNTVLLVENNETDTFLFHRALCRVGAPALSCHAVTNVEDAVRWLNEMAWKSSPPQVPCLVVCDLRLREGTSFDLVELMSVRPEFRGVPVVLWAGAMTPADSQQVADLGISNTLAKSGDVEPLAQWLRTLLCATAKSEARLKAGLKNSNADTETIARVRSR